MYVLCMLILCYVLVVCAAPCAEPPCACRTAPGRMAPVRRANPRLPARLDRDPAAPTPDRQRRGGSVLSRQRVISACAASSPGTSDPVTRPYHPGTILLLGE